MVYRLAFLLLFFIPALVAVAQPTLPDLSGSADKGIVILTWNCQYAGLKSILVMRSADSLHNFAKIGEVEKLEKGVQAFVDGHPAPGKNYYKLNIIFSSGLKWTSNLCKVNVDKLPLESSRSLLPGNDSLQKYIVKAEPSKPGSPTPATGKQDAKTNQQKTASVINQNNNPAASPPKTGVSISFEMDTLQVNAKGWLDTSTSSVAGTKHKISITFDDPDNNPLLTLPRYLSTDSVSGHVRISLPDDVKQHHYSLKFLNKQNQAIFEIPRLNAPVIIMDKRNFQQKGNYKFVLRRDVTELESGYITIW